MAKERIIEALGEGELLLPELVHRALAANDRVKYLLTLLQTAREAAEDGGDAPDLREERIASGVRDASLDAVVRESVRRDDGSYVIPGAAGLIGRAFGEVDTMLAPLRLAEVEAIGPLEVRVAELVGALAPDGDAVGPEDVSRLTAGRHDGDDSLHLVVMAAHRELNRLEQGLATESIDGALAYELVDGDRALVSAFMRGLKRTERLRFDHPGLGTVATRSGDALVLQNDIGETDAHVVVIRVVEQVATVTYTDNHLTRLLFFQGLFSPWEVRWEDTRSRRDRAMEDGLYHLAVGRFEAKTGGELGEFLAFLGSRMVFLIDWNRARKRLRGLVGKRAAVDLLAWCAEQEHGHMAFLLAGGDQLVYDALEFAAGRTTRAGDSLTDVLGAEAAGAYLRAVLRICSEGLLADRAMSLIRDEVRAELISHLRTARQELLVLIGEHAELVVQIGEASRDALEQATLPGRTQRPKDATELAREWERDADEIVNRVRIAAARAEDPAPFLELVEAADDVADSLEEAAYYFGLLAPGRPSGTVRGRGRRLAALVLTSAREYLRAVMLGREVQRGGPREDMDAFLEAVHRIVALERETDEIERSVHAALVEEVDAAGELFVLVEATRALEEAADSLMHAARRLRDLPNFV